MRDFKNRALIWFQFIWIRFDPRDIGRELAESHGVPIYQSIRQALTLGGNELAVDGVLLIGEHGDYPYNELEQQHVSAPLSVRADLRCLRIKWTFSPCLLRQTSLL